MNGLCQILYQSADLTHFGLVCRVLRESGTMQRIYSNENMKQDDESDSSSIQSEISRATKTREKFEALNDAQKRKIFSLLDEWEEPDRTSNDDVSGL